MGNDFYIKLYTDTGVIINSVTMKAFILISLCFLTGVECKVPPTYSTDLETELRQGLLTGYEMMQRPAKTVPITTTLNLLSLNYLDIKDQKLSMTAYFQFMWIDRRLAWKDNSTYSNIIFIFSNELTLWRPAVIIENSVVDVDVISKPQVPMRVRSDGTVNWTPGGVYTTTCEMDVTYYPLDVQTCDIKLSTWAYTSNEVSLRHSGDKINMEYYQMNGEWEILDTTYSSHTTQKEGQSFSRLKYTIKFRRRPLFHMLNTLFPVILMGFLTVVIFKLPPESGERVGLSLTILLAYAVYLTLISENIPETSLSASVLSAYLAAILLLQTLAVFLTVMYLDIYFRSDEILVPKWLQTFASCMDCRKNTSKIRPTSSNCTSNTHLTENTTMSELDLDVTSISQVHPRTASRISITSAGSVIDEKPNRLNKTKGHETPNNDDEIDSVWDGEDPVHNYTWKEVALFLDQFTMYLYLGLVAAVTLISMAIIGFSYMSGSD